MLISVYEKSENKKTIFCFMIITRNSCEDLEAVLFVSYRLFHQKPGLFLGFYALLSVTVESCIVSIMKNLSHVFRYF